MTEIKTNELFGYTETDEGRLVFFSTICHELEDFLTKPLDVYQEVMSESERIDFIKNKLEDAYEAENDYRREEIDQRDFYDLNHLACFSIKNKPNYLQRLEEDEGEVYGFEVEDDGTIYISLLNEWDSHLITPETYSQRLIEGFCGYYGVDENDVLDKVVSIQG